MSRETSKTRREGPVTDRQRGGARAGASTTARLRGGGRSLPRWLSPRKQPRQGRSRETVEAILEASAELLASGGYAGTSTNRIAARAGVSVGSLYQYYPNKDAILTALLERHAAGVERVIRACLEDLRRDDTTIREVFGRMLNDFEALHDANPTMARAAEACLDGRPHLVAAITRHHEEHLREETALILRERPDVRAGHYEIMASLLFDIADVVVRSLMHGDARRFDRRQAFGEATEALCRYIERR